MVNKAETRENDTDGNPLVIQIEVSKVAIWCYLRILEKNGYTERRVGLRRNIR